MLPGRPCGNRAVGRQSIPGAALRRTSPHFGHGLGVLGPSSRRRRRPASEDAVAAAVGVGVGGGFAGVRSARPVRGSSRQHPRTGPLRSLKKRFTFVLEDHCIKATKEPHL